MFTEPQGSGALAQLVERLICIQEVRSSILLGSTNNPLHEVWGVRLSPRVNLQGLSTEADSQIVASAIGAMLLT